MAPLRPLLSFVSHLAFVYCVWHIWISVLPSARRSLLLRFPGVGRSGRGRLYVCRVRALLCIICHHGLSSSSSSLPVSPCVCVIFDCLCVAYIYIFFFARRLLFLRFPGPGARGRCSEYVWHARAFACIAIMGSFSSSYFLRGVSPCVCVFLCVAYGYIFFFARRSLLLRFPGVGRAGPLQFVRVTCATFPCLICHTQKYTNAR